MATGLQPGKAPSCLGPPAAGAEDHRTTAAGHPCTSGHREEETNSKSGTTLGGVRELKVTPHVAQHTGPRSVIDGRTGHVGYTVSQRKRKRVEEIFGWVKTVGLMRKSRHRELAWVGWMFTFTVAVYNLVRIRNLVESSAWRSGGRTFGPRSGRRAPARGGCTALLRAFFLAHPTHRVFVHNPVLLCWSVFPHPPRRTELCCIGQESHPIPRNSFSRRPWGSP